jgi:ubiquinone/menaquinone biosynthesis C-methylase UbiE
VISAVDVACGTGRVTAMLAERWPRVTGVDPSEAMLAVARTKNLSASFEHGAFDAIPLEDGAADIVTCALALTHVVDLGAAVAELSRITRHGGAVVLSDIHPVLWRRARMRSSVVAMTVSA